MNRSPQQVSTFSEYNQQFRKYSGSTPRKLIKPAQQPLNRDSKMACETINRQDFTPHPVTPRAMQPPAVYKKPEGTVSSNTEYRMTFEAKTPEPVVSYRPANSWKEKDAFDHISTQAADFVTFAIPESENYAVKRTYVPPKDPMETKSTVGRDFVDFGSVKPPQSLKPPQTPKLSGDPFDGKTCYRQCFTPQKIPPRYQHTKEVYKPSPDKFSSLSSYSKDYPGHVGRIPAPSMKPQEKKVASDSPFEGATESRLSYRTWELPPKHFRPPTVFSPPTESFSKLSTFKVDYPDYGRTEARRAIRPAPRPMPGAEQKFRPTTTQRADFQLWDQTQVQRSTPIRQKGNYEPSTEKFNALSTCQDHYRGTPGARSLSFKPVLKPMATTEEMGNNTTYRVSFLSSGFSPCPARVLTKDMEQTNNFSFSHQNPSTGHLYFATRPPMATPTLV